MKSFLIDHIASRLVLGDEGSSALEVDVVVSGGITGTAVGKVHDVDVEPRVELINERIANELIGESVGRQSQIDALLKELDGTPDFSHFGIITLLTISMAVCKAAAVCCGLPLYRYLGGLDANEIPIPMISVVRSKLPGSFWEVSVLPTGFSSFFSTMKECRKLLGETGTVFHKIEKAKNSEEAVELLEQVFQKGNITSEIKICCENDGGRRETGQGIFEKGKTSENKSRSKGCEFFDLSEAGTVSDLMRCLRKTKRKSQVVNLIDGFQSSETFGADLAVGGHAGFVKLGSIFQGNGVSQANRLLAIEAELGKSAVFGEGDR